MLTDILSTTEMSRKSFGFTQGHIVSTRGLDLRNKKWDMADDTNVK